MHFTSEQRLDDGVIERDFGTSTEVASGATVFAATAAV